MDDKLSKDLGRVNGSMKTSAGDLDGTHKTINKSNNIPTNDLASVSKKTYAVSELQALDTITVAQTNNTLSIDSAEIETVTVCCGFRPKAKRKTKRFRKLKTSEGSGKKWWKKALKKVKHIRYRQTNVREEELEWKPFHRNSSFDRRSVKSNDSGLGASGGGGDEDSLYYFDAEENELDDDEYPISGYAIQSSLKSLKKFKVVFRTDMEHPAPKVSLSDPASMLHPRSRTSSIGSQSSLNDYEDTAELETIEVAQPIKQKGRILNHKQPSARFRKIRKRTTEQLTADLQKEAPPNNNSAAVLEDTIGLAGYPGTLTKEELEECQKFVRGLNDLPASVAEQIYSFRDIEDQPYTICRWLRAMKFNADQILARCADNQPLFDEAKENDFYGPHLDEHLGCPYSVFLSQYPFLSIGLGKNGSPVNYFQIGNINPEGIMCLITVEQLKKYYWYSFMHKFKDQIRVSQTKNPDFCRCEGINVLDLGGLSASAITTETMEVIKICSKISDFFPETLHCILVFNAPSFFTFSWKLIRNFIDPRTASRVQLFSSKEKGQKALEKLVDKELEIPSDYGGGNISLREAFLNECSDSNIIRQEIELLHCRRRGKKALKNTWTISADESIEITIYTRSVGKASVQVDLNGSNIKSVDAQCSFAEDSGTSTPRPNKITAMTSLAGPGEVMIEIKDLDTPVSKANFHCSRGYFLVVGDVKKMSRNRPHKSSSVSMTGSIPSAPATNRKVSFSLGTDVKKNNDQGSTHTSPYNSLKPSINAKVTMTGLTLTPPIKVPVRDLRKRKENKFII
eukprot:CAMPEP_0197190734 /NCGR_PEP_ID=MMETSP1423-20130617/22205_1 /TAXON_ID=476441 /ORGANISM="Pseudo-nitzschia heimii, Strain UNC1101" /LENGTH=795 /DNA_ID=CAMNT_0042643187 /DNA_START=236 /DNA_END=2623 /DNA_ORIENTATION=-